MLGVDPEASYPVTELRLDPGAVLALFTDGLVEKAGIDIDEGIERLRSTLDAVGHMPLAEAADRVIGQARQDEDRPDDIALLMAARRDPSRSNPAGHSPGRCPACGTRPVPTAPRARG